MGGILFEPLHSLSSDAFFSVIGVDWSFFSVIGELQLTGEQVAKHYWVAGGQVGQYYINIDFGSYSFCVALFDRTGRFCDYHFQSYFQVPIETREDWLDTADIVQVTFFTNSQQHLSLYLGDSEPLLF